MVIKPFINLH